MTMVQNFGGSRTCHKCWKFDSCRVIHLPQISCFSIDDHVLQSNLKRRSAWHVRGPSIWPKSTTQQLHIRLPPYIDQWSLLTHPYLLLVQVPINWSLHTFPGVHKASVNTWSINFWLFRRESIWNRLLFQWLEDLLSAVYIWRKLS